MSGHSKWNNIKRKKEKTDGARAKVFTKIGREIAVAVKEGGGNPASNSKLAALIAKAKANSVPNDNIQRIIKRAMDLVLCGIAMIPAAPVMLIIAAAIKIEDGGPVFYKQKRMTRGGREFEILKFRSMIVDAEKYAGAVLASEDDPRITKVGKVIRAARLDELPQLINILKGDMSIVGPRPERKCLADEISKEIPEFCYRLKVRGGLTGYAQIYGKYNTSAYDKLRLDMMYIENYSPLLDIRLIILTLRIIFSKDSTEGIDVAMENQRRADELWRELDEENEEKEKGGAE